jgi:hypothetical protein
MVVIQSIHRRHIHNRFANNKQLAWSWRTVSGSLRVGARSMNSLNGGVIPKAVCQMVRHSSSEWMHGRLR